DFARRESNRNGVRAAEGHLPSGDTKITNQRPSNQFSPTNSHKKLNGFNGLQAAKSGSTSRIFGPRRVIEREVIAGCDWREEISPDGVVVKVTRLQRGRK